jgi:hypothetical protein
MAEITSLFRSIPLCDLLLPFSSFDLIGPFLDLNIQFAKLNLEPKNLEKMKEIGMGA